MKASTRFMSTTDLVKRFSTSHRMVSWLIRLKGSTISIYMCGSEMVCFFLVTGENIESVQGRRSLLEFLGKKVSEVVKLVESNEVKR